MIMGTRISVNKEVEITAVYFRNDVELKSFPRRMEFDGETYTFLDGIRCLIQKGQDFVQLFDMTDGDNNYRLKFDAKDATWTLLNVSNAPRAVV